jgi:hypothetical protein
VNLQRPAAPAPAEAVALAPAPAAALSILTLQPGQPLAALQQTLAGQGVSLPTERGRLLIYDTTLFDTIDTRQRLVLERDDGQVRRSAVIVEFADTQDPPAMERTYQRVLERLYRRLGPPRRSFDTGRFDGDIAERLRSGTFRRLTEWGTPAGTVRLGIPTRADGQVRIEIHYGGTLPSPTRNDWSLDAVL